MSSQLATSHSYNAPEDTRYSHVVPDFTRVIHVFHREWPGIRAAATYLPGQKLAISALRVVEESELAEVVALILQQSPSKIIFHGLSDQATALIDALNREGLSTQLFLVFHGAPPQWHDEYDRRQALTCLRLAARGRVRRLHVLKTGFDFPIDRLYRPMLFNMTPNTQGLLDSTTPKKHSTTTALVPGRQMWTKNLFTNILGAALSPKVDYVQTHFPGMDLPYPLENKVVQVEYEPDLPFQSLVESDVVLNVSVVDCHPMVNIEAQAFGKACLRGNLHLDALENHPYVGLTTVDDIASVMEIRRCLDRILSIPSEEITALTADYQHASDEVSLRRYRDFLEL